MEILPSTWWSFDITLGIMEKVSEKTDKINQRAKQLNHVHKLVTQKEPDFLDKAGHYIEATVHHAGEYVPVPVEDVSVLKDGKTAEGKPVTKIDYAFAAVGMFIPFVNGSQTKYFFKGFWNVANNYNVDNFFVERGIKNFTEFYDRARKMGVNDRVNEYKAAGKRVAEANLWTKNNKYSKQFDRDVYENKDGKLFSLDTQQGEFEILNSKGKHQGAMDFEGVKTKDLDKSGKHDLKIE